MSDQVTDLPSPQRSLKLSLTNKEMCTAAFWKTVSFDLTPLRIKGTFKMNVFHWKALANHWNININTFIITIA